MLLWRWGTRCTPLEATAPGRTTRHSVRLMCMSSTQVGGEYTFILKDPISCGFLGIRIISCFQVFVLTVSAAIVGIWLFIRL